MNFESIRLERGLLQGLNVKYVIINWMPLFVNEENVSENAGTTYQIPFSSLNN